MGEIYNREYMAIDTILVPIMTTVIHRQGSEQEEDRWELLVRSEGL
jgi:hypothetical protein